MRQKLKMGVALSFVIGCLTTSPALADSANGSGAAFAVKVGTESVTIFATFQTAGLVLHVRNVGSRSATIRFIPQCTAGTACDTPRTLSVKPVAHDTDASEDGALTFRGSARTFSWTITT